MSTVHVVSRSQYEQMLERAFYHLGVSVWVCPRCHQDQTEPLWTVPIYMPASEPNWVHLCADCFRLVLGGEPPDQISRHMLIAKQRTRRRQR
jgi:hypothetical protein